MRTALAMGVRLAAATLALALVAAPAAAVDPPHLNDCSTCHTPHSAPGGAITLVAGNANLCQSCHQAGGPAAALPFAAADQASPVPGLPVGMAASGTSHRWDSGPSGWVGRAAGNASPGSVTSGGAFSGRFAKTYTLTVTTAGQAGVARFDWSATTPGGGSGTNVLTGAAVPLDQGITVTFTDGPTSPSFVAGSQWRVYVRTDLNLPADAEMAVRLEDGKLMCSTCHDQHDQQLAPFDPAAPPYGGAGTGAGRHYQRAANANGEMCVDCHAARDVTQASQGSHPVGVTIPASGAYQAPTSLPLDAGSRVACMSCHQPHFAPAADGTLARLAGNLTLCIDCHTLADTGSPGGEHFDSVDAATLWPGGQYGSTFPAVTDAAKRGSCANCHYPHGWPDSGNLAQDYPTLGLDLEESQCTTCHDGSPVPQDVRAEFGKSSAHPLALASRVHTPGEAAVVASRHVECVDCHNPHRARRGSGPPGAGTAPRAATGPLAGVRGVDLSGAAIDPAAFEYEVCLRCHADSPGKPASPTARQFRPVGATAETNVRLEFGGGFSSFHTVATQGTINDHVPSLYNGWSKTSYLACTSCHNNNDLTGSGGGLNYRDEFPAIAYNGSNGTENWTPSPWVETDAGGGGAGSGNVRVTTSGNCAAGNCLRIEPRQVGDSAYRQANLSTATTATLTLRFNNQLSGSDRVRLEVSGDGGGTWTQLKDYIQSNQGTGTDSFDVTAFIAANTRIRFLVVAQGANQRIWIDNVDLGFTVPGGGGPPNGPHGSTWPRLLERRFETGDPSTYQQVKYDLCFKCHNPSTILNGNVSFERHSLHISGESTSCNVCHDPHGSAGQRFLVNFDTSVVTPTSGRLEFIAPPVTGGSGSCYLVCHGKDHNPETYNSNY